MLFTESPLIISTQRLTLRPVETKDFPVVGRALSDPMVVRYYGVQYATPEEARIQMQWFDDIKTAGTGFWWAICTSGNAECIGAVGLNDLNALSRKAQLGFWLLPAYWGNGYGTEAVRAIVQHAFTHFHLSRIEAHVETENRQSARLLTRAGFRLEVTRVECEQKGDRRISLDVFVALHQMGQESGSS